VRVQFVCNSTNCPPGGVTVCAPDAFTVRPADLTVSSSANADASGTSASATPRLVAGATFNLTADANTAGYDGTPNFDASKAEWPSAPAGGRAGGVGSVGGYFTTAAAIATGNGATGNNFAYDEVGYFRLAGAGVYDIALAGYSGDVGSGDCVAGSYSNTPDASGRVGCLLANTSATSHFGRFIPHHFDQSLTPGCNAGSFTYSAQPFNLRLTALNASNATTQNYSQSFAQAVTLSDANAVAGGALAPVNVASSSFTGGVANLTPAFSFTRMVPDKAPGTVRPRAVDTDSVSSATGTEGTTVVRIGRLRLSSVYGAVSPLRMPVEAQFWSGLTWVKNTDDSCTSLAAGNFSMSPAGWGLAAPGVLAGGSGFVTLTPTGPGSVSVCADLGADNGITCSATSAALPWLQSKWPPAASYSNDPSANATFGVFGAEGRRGVYNREMY
jgi:MSHA biogenesis protein MshQ